MDKEKGKEIIIERVNHFSENQNILIKKNYGETNIRSNYIDILFSALGWDMQNHCEVIREYSQKDNNQTKKIDYVFKIDGKVKLYVEAKNATIDLVNDKSAIYQAKRYAYSSNGKSPIVILTNFKQFRVFNVLKIPYMEKPNVELLKYCSMEYIDYIEKWDLLWSIFSKEAVENGSLELLKEKIDKNTRLMDADFLNQITIWRELLAKNIAINNNNLNVDQINEAIQRIIDRFIFIRYLEDKQIEQENILYFKLNEKNIYKSIIPIFGSLDTIYNGLLFKKHFSENIYIDDKIIKKIINQLYYPISPFQFDIIEPEILGRIYEKFLGSKIRFTEEHRIKIEEKTDLKKSKGIYYTPEIVVEYIIDNTIKKKIEGLTPHEIKKIKIIDPSCGSGSFLLKAYACILDYHQKWYDQNQNDKLYQNDWYKNKDGKIIIKIEKRGEILKNNIFGVDIDKEAIEVAIMSLYLQMLTEGLDKSEKDIFFVKGSLLPDITKNIKCGNSIISTDFIDDSNINDVKDIKKINPFNWYREFNNIFNEGGFDVVVGNPPYGSLNYTKQSLKDNYIEELKYWNNRYSLYNWRINFIMLFYEMIFFKVKLLKPNGIFGMIIDFSFLEDSFSKLRNTLLNKITLEFLIINLNFFKNVKSGQIITIFTNKEPNETSKYLFAEDTLDHRKFIPLFQKNIQGHIKLNKSHFIKNDIIDKISNLDTIKPLSFLYETSYGAEIGGKKDSYKYFIYDDIKEKGDFIKIIDLDNFSRYSKIQYNQYLKYDKEKEKEIRKKFIKLNVALRDRGIWKKERIIMRQSSKNITASLEQSESISFLNAFHIWKKENSSYSLEFLLGILNSKLMNYYAKHSGIIIGGEGKQPQIRIEGLRKIPIITITNFYEFKLVEHYQKLEKLVKIILQLNAKIDTSNDEIEKQCLLREIIEIDNQINNVVYTMYNLTKVEIEKIESESF